MLLAFFRTPFLVVCFCWAAYLSMQISQICWLSWANAKQSFVVFPLPMLQKGMPHPSHMKRVRLCVPVRAQQLHLWRLFPGSFTIACLITLSCSLAISLIFCPCRDSTSLVLNSTMVMDLACLSLPHCKWLKHLRCRHPTNRRIILTTTCFDP